MSATRRKSFWQLLVEEGLISAQALREAVRRAQEEGGRLEAHLVDLGLDDEAFARFIASRFHVPLTLLEDPPDAGVLALVPREVAQAFLLVPFAVADGRLFVAMANPLQEEAYLELERLTDRTVVAHVAPLSRIREALARYPDRAPAEGLVARFSLRAAWGSPHAPALDAIQPLPAQREGYTALRNLERTPPDVLVLVAPSGSGRTWLATAWGRGVAGEGVRWVDGKAVYSRWNRLQRRGYGDVLVDLLAQPACLILDVPEGDPEFWESVLRERVQRGGRSVVVLSSIPEGRWGDWLAGFPRAVLDPPGEEDVQMLLQIRGARLPEALIGALFRMTRGHLRRLSGLLDSLQAATGGDWSRVTPEMLRRLGAKQGG